MIAAVVPVKSLASAKSRLLPALGREAVERLSIAMLRDILATLLDVSGIDRIAVVTPDTNVAAVAKEAGVEVVLTTTSGLNPSIEEAAAKLGSGPDDGSLVVLGDVAGVCVRDIDRLLSSLTGRGVALAPSNDGGTSALLRVPRDVIEAGFGPASARVHRELAQRAGVPYHELVLASLAIDIDRPEDLEAFLGSQAFGERTRALLRELLAGDPP